MANWNGMTNDIANGYQNPAFNFGLPPYPQGYVQTPYGQPVQYQTSKTINLHGTGIPNLIRQGKYGQGLTDQQKQAVTSNPYSVNLDNLTSFLTNKAKQKGKKVHGVSLPTFNPQPASQDYFNFLQNSEIERAHKQDAFNKTYLEPLLNQITGLQGKAIGSASNYLDKGFTDLDPRQQAAIDSAGSAFYNSAADRFKRDYTETVGGMNEDLAAGGIAPGNSPASRNVINRTADRELADNLRKLSYDSEVYKQQLGDQKLGQARSGYATVAGTPSFNSAMSGLTLPGLDYKSQFANPGGQYDLNTLLNALQFSQTYGLESQQLKQAPYIAGIPGMIGAAGRNTNPWGNILGTAAGAAMMAI